MDLQPWDYDSRLSEDKLEVIAKMMLDITNDTYELLSTINDNAYTRGTTVFGRVYEALINAGFGKQYDWLDIRKPQLDITFEINNIPCRFYTGDPRKPRAKFFEDNGQGDLFPTSEKEVSYWRFIIEKATQEIDEHKIHFVGFNAFVNPIVFWTYDPSIAVLESNLNIDDADLYLEAEIEEAPLTPKDGDIEEQAL